MGHPLAAGRIGFGASCRSWNGSRRRVSAPSRPRGKHCTIHSRTLADVPPLEADGGIAETLARAVTHVQSEPTTVPFATEGGQFQRAGWSTVVCGPGISSRRTSRTSTSSAGAPGLRNLPGPGHRTSLRRIAGGRGGLVPTSRRRIPAPNEGAATMSGEPTVSDLPRDASRARRTIPAPARRSALFASLYDELRRSRNAKSGVARASP